MSEFQTYVDTEGKLLRPTSAPEAQRLAELGYAKADDAAFARDKVRQQYSSGWASLAAGATSVIPGAQSLALGAASAAGYGKEAGMYAGNAEEANPWLYRIGQGAAVVGSVGAAVAAAPAVAAGGALAGLAGLVGTGAALGAASKADEHMLQYVQTGEGSEKLWSELGSGALWGAALNVGIAGAGRALGAVGGRIGRYFRPGASAEFQATADRVEQLGVLREEGLERINQLERGPEILEWGQQNGVFEMSPENAKGFLKQEMRNAKGRLNQVRNASREELSPRENARLQATLQDALGDKHYDLERLARRAGRNFDGDRQVVRARSAGVAEDGSEIIERTIHTEPGKPTIKNLHNMRIALDKEGDFNVGPQREYQVDMRRARDAIDRGIQSILRRIGNPELTQSFNEGNIGFHAAQTLVNQLPGKETTATAAQNLFAAGVRSGVGGAVGSVLGGPFGGFAGAGVASALGPAFQRRAAVGTLRSIGNLLERADDSFAGAVVSGLGSVGSATARGVGNVATQSLRSAPARGILAASLIENEHYQPIATEVQAAAQDPQAAVEKFSTRLADAQVPQQIIDAQVPRYQAALAVCEEYRPKANAANATVSPSQHIPSATEMRNFMDCVNTVTNPAYALAHLNPVRKAVLQRVFPETFAKTHQIVSEHAATADLSPRAAAYAGAVTGMPASPTFTPGARQAFKTFSEMRKAKLEQMQAQSQAGRSGSGGESAVKASESRADRMAR